MPKKNKSTAITIFTILLILLLLSLFLYKYNCVEGFESSPKTFNSDVNGGKKLVWFYADWCGHCKNMADSWNKASSKVNKSNDNKMIKINVGEDDIEQKRIVEKYNIKGYPTILILQNGNIVSLYEGERDESSLISYVNNNLIH